MNPQVIRHSLSQVPLHKNLRKRLNLSTLASTDEIFELFAIATKDTHAGVLFAILESGTYAAPYEISAVRDAITGRSKPVICDFCKTWQSGGHTSTITFRTSRRSLNSISFLCCADLKCSLHVRNRTDAALLSRAQLREDITPEYRIQRLQDKLQLLVERLNLKPIQPIE